MHPAIIIALQCLIGYAIPAYLHHTHHELVEQQKGYNREVAVRVFFNQATLWSGLAFVLLMGTTPIFVTTLLIVQPLLVVSLLVAALVQHEELAKHLFKNYPLAVDGYDWLSRKATPVITGFIGLAIGWLAITGSWFLGAGAAFGGVTLYLDEKKKLPNFLANLHEKYSLSLGSYIFSFGLLALSPSLFLKAVGMSAVALKIAQLFHEHSVKKITKEAPALTVSKDITEENLAGILEKLEAVDASPDIRRDADDFYEASFGLTDSEKSDPFFMEFHRLWKSTYGGSPFSRRVASVFMPNFSHMAESDTLVGKAKAGLSAADELKEAAHFIAPLKTAYDAFINSIHDKKAFLEGVETIDDFQAEHSSKEAFQQKTTDEQFEIARKYAKEKMADFLDKIVNDTNKEFSSELGTAGFLLFRRRVIQYFNYVLEKDYKSNASQFSADFLHVGLKDFVTFCGINRINNLKNHMFLRENIDTGYHKLVTEGLSKREKLLYDLRNLRAMHFEAIYDFIKKYVSKRGVGWIANKIYAFSDHHTYPKLEEIFAHLHIGSNKSISKLFDLGHVMLLYLTRPFLNIYLSMKQGYSVEALVNFVAENPERMLAVEEWMDAFTHLETARALKSRLGDAHMRAAYPQAKALEKFIGSIAHSARNAIESPLKLILAPVFEIYQLNPIEQTVALENKFSWEKLSALSLQAVSPVVERMQTDFSILQSDRKRLISAMDGKKEEMDGIFKNILLPKINPDEVNAVFREKCKEYGLEGIKEAARKERENYIREEAEEEVCDAIKKTKAFFEETMKHSEMQCLFPNVKEREVAVRRYCFGVACSYEHALQQLQGACFKTLNVVFKEAFGRHLSDWHQEDRGIADFCRNAANIKSVQDIFAENAIPEQHQAIVLKAYLANMKQEVLRKMKMHAGTKRSKVEEAFAAITEKYQLISVLVFQCQARARQYNKWSYNQAGRDHNINHALADPLFATLFEVCHLSDSEKRSMVQQLFDQSPLDIDLVSKLWDYDYSRLPSLSWTEDEQQIARERAADMAHLQLETLLLPGARAVIELYLFSEGILKVDPKLSVSFPKPRPAGDQDRWRSTEYEHFGGTEARDLLEPHLAPRVKETAPVAVAPNPRFTPAADARIGVTGSPAAALPLPTSVLGSMADPKPTSP